VAAITLTNVQKSYGANAVIHGVNASFNDGEFIVIVGPSGCGKSTLLRMIAGLEVCTAGTIQIGERIVNDVEPKDRDIAMVFQNYALYPHMSVADNMAYGLRIRGTPKAEIERRVAEAADILELTGLLARKPRELSGGQRQRVAMGRAIVRKPAAFLFDEPLSNLDARLRIQMRLEIQKLHRTLQTTSIFVTHDQVEAMTLADRMLVMNAGRVEQFGSPMAVYENPATPFVASFIGSPAMNLLPAACVREQWPWLPATTRAIGVRPEHLTLSPVEMVAAGPAPAITDGVRWETRVETIEALGADTLIHVRIADTPVVIRTAGYTPREVGCG
jgi:sn-glycerol 3-phosphate transport system ATP-binding protein